MGCKESKIENGHVYNKNAHKQRKAFVGIQLGKNPDNGGLGIEGNFQAAYNFKKDVKFEKVADAKVETENEIIQEN